MPTDPPPPPEVDSAPKRCVLSPATSVIDASAVKPCDVTTANGSTTASFFTIARLRATPAPIATPELVVLALPSAFARESVLAEDKRVSAPAALMWMPAGMYACALVLVRLIATAAATVTAPDEVPAVGAAVEPDPPDGGARLSA